MLLKDRFQHLQGYNIENGSWEYKLEEEEDFWLEESVGGVIGLRKRVTKISNSKQGNWDFIQN